MIVKNGFMQLVCIKGLGERDAWFMNVRNNELIIASGCKWVNHENGQTNVDWNCGEYLGEIKNHMKKVK